MTEMKALRALPGEPAARVVQTAIPEIGPNDVLLKVESAGLTPGPFNMLAIGRLKNLPMTLGHQVAGTIAKTGENVERFAVGNRVRLYPNISCGTCRYCRSGQGQLCDLVGTMGFVAFGDRQTRQYIKYRDGGLAHYVAAPASCIDMLPDGVSFDVGAKIHDLANAFRCLAVAALTPGATVVILAATGSMGIATIKMAEVFGVSRLVLVARSTERLEALRTLSNVSMTMIGLDQLGPGWVEQKALAEAVKGATQGPADAVIDFAPQGTDLWQVLSALATNGVFVHVGGNPAPLPLPMLALIQKCWRIVGTRNHSRSDSDAVLRLLGDGSLKADDLISHRFSFAEMDEAIRSLRSRSRPMWMTVVHPHED